LFLRMLKLKVLWDCLPLLDEAVVEAMKALGGTVETPPQARRESDTPASSSQPHPYSFLYFPAP